MYSKYARVVKDALEWLDEKEPTWQLDEPIDKEAFLEDLLFRTGLTIQWNEEFISIIDQSAKCVGVVRRIKK